MCNIMPSGYLNFKWYSGEIGGDIFASYLNIQGEWQIRSRTELC